MEALGSNKVCDLCNIPLTSEAYRYTSSQIQSAVRAGLRPPSTALELGAAFGMSKSQAEQSWIQRVMSDTTDWLLCSNCVSKNSQYLPSSVKWIEDRKRIQFK